MRFRRTRRLTGKLGLSAVAVALCLTLVEGMLALMGRCRPEPYWYTGEQTPAMSDRVDRLVGWTMEPDHVSTTGWSSEFRVTYRSDNSGFRRGDTAADHGASAPWVFIGDSFTFGNGVEYEDTFAYQIGETLSVPIRNLGMSGFGIDQIWQTLLHYGRPLKPRVVVLAYVDDDLRRGLTAYRSDGTGWRQKPTFRLEHGTIVQQHAADRPRGLLRFVACRSRFVQMWRSAEWNLSRRHSVGRIWELNEAIFRSVQEDVRAAGAHLLVVRIPEKDQRGSSPASSALVRLGIDVLDLGEHLPEDCSLALYYRKDPHLTAAGHAWVAEHIARHLVATGAVR